MDDKRLETLADKWTNDQTFREALRADPQKAVADLGITLDEDERAALDSLDFANLSDAELEQRVSQSTGISLLPGGGGNC